MTDYVTTNRQAWEEAFDNRKSGWGDDLVSGIRDGGHLFLEPKLLEEIQLLDLKNKTIGQFCCNNGRELLSLMTLGANLGIGFDIAQNMIDFANAAANELMMKCRFIQSDILALDSRYHNMFDFILITTGALTWFDNLEAFFRVAAACLKSDGCLIISDMHPVTGMLPMPGEDNYAEDTRDRLVNSYFRQTPWIETQGISYMSDPNKNYTQTLTSFSHTFADIFNAMSTNGLQIKHLRELDEDFSGSFGAISRQGIPLSYILTAQR